jgi:hypothetical protein
MEVITSTILGVIIDRAAGLLTSSFSTSVKLADVDQKIDSLIQGDYLTACRLLEETSSLSGRQRAYNLQEALRLFELSASRFEILAKNKRENIFGIVEEFNPKTFIKKAAKRDSYLFFDSFLSGEEANIYETLTSHVVHEYLWLLCRIGSLRTAVEVGDPTLISCKRTSLAGAARDVLSFIEAVRQKQIRERITPLNTRAFKLLWYATRPRSKWFIVIGAVHRVATKNSPRKRLNQAQGKYSNIKSQLESWGARGELAL